MEAVAPRLKILMTPGSKKGTLPKHLNHCVIFTAITQFTNVAAGSRPTLQTENKFQPKRENALPNQEYTIEAYL